MRKILYILVFCSKISLGQVPEIVKVINPKDERGDIRDFVKLGSSLYFTSQVIGVNNAKIFKTDGTTANTILVKDFSDNLFNGQIYVSDLVTVGTLIFFKVYYSPNSGSGNLNDNQLWKTDGTTAGTLMVKDFLIYGLMSDLGYCAIGNTLVFQAGDAINGTEFWKSDGTLAGTTLVKDINTNTSSPISSSPKSFINFNGVVYFSAYNPTTGLDLWKTDGTTAGTVLVKDLPNAINTSIKKMTAGNGKFYFVIFQDYTYQYDLWTSDGTDLGTIFIRQISTNNSFYQYDICYFNNFLYFSSMVSGDNTLWKTDGTVAGSVQVYSNSLGQYRFFTKLTAINTKLFFKLTVGSKDDIYITDATVASILSLTSSLPYVGDVKTVGSQLFFGGTETSTGNELYKTDGTLAGTVLVKDIVAGTGSGLSGIIGAEINNKLVFQGYDPVYNEEPFVSDGTAAGTFLLFNTQTKGLGSSPSLITKIGTRLYFGANSGQFYKDPWYSDGTSAGTLLLKDLQSFNGEPISFLDVDGTNFFFKSNGNKLYKSDETATGTVLLNPYNSVGNMAYTGSTLYFTHYISNTIGEEIYKYQAGSVSLVKDINLGIASTTPNQLTVFNSLIYFFADDGTNGRELWKTDGTDIGTTLVEDVNVGSGSSNPSVFGVSEERLFNFNNNLYFLRYDGSTCNFYKSNGATGGSTILHNWTTGSQLVDNFYVFNNQLYFVVIYDSFAKTELWKTDGTAAGTVLVKQIFAGANYINSYSDAKTFSFLTLGGKFYFHFRATSFSGTPRLLSFWSSDGTTGGTSALATYNLPLTGTIPSYSMNEAESNAAIISATETMFTFFDATHGLELWKTDGTVANTQFLYDINPGLANSNPAGLQSFNNAIYFSATNGSSGQEFWKFDPNLTIFESITTGNWNVGSTWIAPTNTLLPTATKTAKINSTHTVNIPNAGNQVKTIQMNGGTINLNGGTLEIKNQ
jgi:trimeric autotransporter adhesin